MGKWNSLREIKKDTIKIILDALLDDKTHQLIYRHHEVSFETVEMYAVIRVNRYLRFSMR